MQDFGIKPNPSIRALTGTPHGANADTRPQRPLPFTRSDTTDGGRFSRARHSVANMTRQLFGRQPHHGGEPANSAMARQEPIIGSMPQRSTQMQQLRNQQEQQRLQQVQVLEQQIRQMQQPQSGRTETRPVYQQVNHPLMQAAAQGRTGTRPVYQQVNHPLMQAAAQGRTGTRPVYQQVNHPLMQAAAQEELERKQRLNNPGHPYPVTEQRNAIRTFL